MIVDGRVVVGDIALGYGSAGTPGAPPIVLLHALGEERATWSDVVDVLANTYRTYAVDLRGHGSSDHPGAYSLELMRDDVIGFLDALDLPSVDFVGHSLGAYVAYLVAMAVPSRVAAMVLEDPPAPLPADPPRDASAEPDGPVDFDWAVVAALAQQRNQPDPLWWDQLDRITARTLVIAGGPDSHLPQDQLLELAHRIPNAEHVTIAAGHCVHENRLAEFLAAAMPVLSR